MGAVPRKVIGSLAFVKQLERAISQWPQDTKQPLTVIASLADIPLPHLVENLSEATGHNVDIHDPISLKEAERSLTLLKQRFRADIAAEEKREIRERERSHAVYEKTMVKVNQLQMEKSWYSAYRTLSYFAGSHEHNLNLEIMTVLCNDCLRLGTKANANFQELVSWFRKGIDSILRSTSLNAIEDALDFVDAYGSYFLGEETGKGKRFITAILSQLNPSAFELGMGEKLETIHADLELPLPQSPALTV